MVGWPRAQQQDERTIRRLERKWQQGKRRIEFREIITGVEEVPKKRT